MQHSSSAFLVLERAPGLAFLDVELRGIRNGLCSAALAASAGLFSLHPGRACRARASTRSSRSRLLRGRPPLWPPNFSRISPRVWPGSSSGRSQGSDWGWGETLSGTLLHRPLHPISCKKETGEAKTIYPAGTSKSVALTIIPIHHPNHCPPDGQLYGEPWRGTP